MIAKEKYNILYIDDEQGNLKVFKSTFRREYNIYTALSGKEGLEIMAREQIHLVITDQQMPGMTGIEVLREVSRRYPKTIRMVLTGYSDLRIVVDAVNECGLFRYLSKPWDNNDMSNAITTGLETYQLRRDNERLVDDLQSLNTSLEERVQAQTESLEKQRKQLLVFNEELKEANQELHSRELRHRTITENFPNGFVSILDPQLSYIFFDGKDLALFQKKSSDFVGHTLQEVHGEYFAYKAGYYYQNSFEGKSETFEIDLWEQTYRIHSIPLKNASDQIHRVLAVGQNITTQKKRQEQLSSKYDFFNKIFDTIPCLLYLFDIRTFEVSFTNEHIQQILGYTSAHIQSQSKAIWKQLIHPEDALSVLKHLNKCKLLQDGETAILEYRMLHKNGHYTWLRSTSTVFERNLQEQPIQLLSYLEDINRARSAEEQLTESKQFLEQINALSPNMIYILNAKTLEISYHNRKAKEMLGYDQKTDADIKGGWVSRIVHAEDWSSVKAHYLSMKELKRGESKSIVYRLKDHTNRWHWVHDTHVVFKKTTVDEETLIMGMAKDITELKEVEIALKASEERLKDTQKLSKLVRWEMNVDTKSIHLYGATIDFTQLPKGDYRSMNDFMRIIHPKDVEQLTQKIEQLINNGTPYEYDMRYKNIDGKEVHLHLIANPFYNAQGKITKVVGSAMDITKIKAYEHQLHQLNESKDRILATVAHDLRSPINNIQGLTTVLKLQMTPIPNDIQEVFNRIEESCKKGLHLISELLEISELESQNYELPVEATFIDEFIQQVLAPFEESSVKNHIQLVANLRCKGVQTKLNAAKFARVIENLMVNAQKFTAEGGAITVSTKVTNEGRILLSISDTGIGIPKDMQPLIFEKFSKASRTGLKGEKSTGLGMSIVKQVVGLHQGEVWLESEEGEGTVFYIELPVVSPNH